MGEYLRVTAGTPEEQTVLASFSRRVIIEAGKTLFRRPVRKEQDRRRLGRKAGGSMRTSTQTRKTKETDISLSLSLEGGPVEISTGIGFFDHMLTAFAVHGGFGLQVKAEGDLIVDGHHTVEDTGIVLGKAFSQALGDKSGIARFGSFYVPMDETLAFASVDVSGRPFLVFRGGIFPGSMRRL